ncbi:hypothetical protein [Streptomyces sp. NPDC058426]|uniref:hypothetical protein n=1 Tax=Streptomyces sp. NPDC058426 TaxID=3346493 RepID=UPI003646E565
MRWIVRDGLLLAVVGEEARIVDGRPSDEAAPVRVVEEAAGSALGDGREDYCVPVQGTDVAFECFEDVWREGDFSAALGALGVFF